MSLAIGNKKIGIPTRIIYYGDYDPFNQDIIGKDRLNGYFIDDLEDENKDNDLFHYLGPIGVYMAFIKCGLTECDVYYSEILAGQLYVGYLYTINKKKDIDDFCPTKIYGFSGYEKVLFKSKCPG